MHSDDPRRQVGAYIVLEHAAVKTLCRVARIEPHSAGKHKIQSRVWLEDCYGFTNEESGEHEFRQRWISLKDVEEKCKLVKAAPASKPRERRLTKQTA